MSENRKKPRKLSRIGQKPPKMSRNGKKTEENIEKP